MLGMNARNKHREYMQSIHTWNECREQAQRMNTGNQCMERAQGINAGNESIAQRLLRHLNLVFIGPWGLFKGTLAWQLTDKRFTYEDCFGPRVTPALEA